MKLVFPVPRELHPKNVVSALFYARTTVSDNFLISFRRSKLPSTKQSHLVYLLVGAPRPDFDSCVCKNVNILLL